MRQVHRSGVLVCGSVFSGADWSCFVAVILFELLPIAVDLLRKPIPPPSPWFRHDASVWLFRPPPWPD